MTIPPRRLRRPATPRLQLLPLPRGGLDVFHINDYPSSPAREKLVDADRVFPGDGICPFKAVLPKMYSQGFRGCLSLELFNKNYWKQPPEKTVAEGYKKTKDTILSALVEVA